MLYLLHGENSYESWIEFKKIRDEYLKKDPNLVLETYDDSDLIERDISFSSMGLFSEKKLYVIKRFFQIPKDRREKIFASFPDFKTEEVIIWEDKKADKRSKVYKDLKKKGVEREFSNLNYRELDKWLGKMANKEEVNLTSEMREELKFRYGNNQWILSNELNKIALYSKSFPANSVFDYREILSSMQDIDTWDFVDYFFSRDKKKSLDFINTALVNSGDEFPLIGALTSQMRCVLVLVRFGSYASDSIASKLKIHPFRLKKSQKYVSGFSEAKLKQIYQLLSNLDYSLKRGEIEPKLGFSLLIATL